LIRADDHATAQNLDLRQMVPAIVECADFGGALDKVQYVNDPVFGIGVPQSCPDVPAEVLTPKRTWADGAAYDAKAKELASLFNKNFATFDNVSADIAEAGPNL